MSAWAESLLLWSLLALVLFWFVGAHNRLVRLRSAAVQAFGALDALIVRQIEYVNSASNTGHANQASHTEHASDDPEAAALTAAGGASASAAGVSSGWAELEQTDPVGAQNQASLQAATAQLAAVLTATRPRPMEPAAMASLATALHVMLSAWARLHPGELVAFASDGTLAPLGSDRGPAAAADPAPLGWPEPTALIEMTRAQFNQAVAQYNAAISQFPALLMAWAFGWHRAAPLV